MPAQFGLPIPPLRGPFGLRALTLSRRFGRWITGDGTKNGLLGSEPRTGTDQPSRVPIKPRDPFIVGLTGLQAFERPSLKALSLLALSQQKARLARIPTML
jgi:hypothetical protein